MNQPHLFWNVECRSVLFWDLFYLLCKYTPFKFRYLSVWYFISFLCRWFPKIECSFSSSCLLFERLNWRCCRMDGLQQVEDEWWYNWAYGHWYQVQIKSGHALMSISGCDIPFSQSVRNLGFYLNETLSMDAHVKYLCRMLFSQLCRIGKIHSFLSTDAANKLAVSLILSRLDYCNSLLAGLPDNKLNKLQRIQNHAARLVLRTSRHASATALLRTLHWLPVKARIQYKIACLCFQCIYQDSMPPYISDLLHPYCPSRMLRSLDALLTVPRFSLETFGKRSFSVFGPTVWNSLPLALRKKHSVLQLLKWNLILIFFAPICAEVQVVVVCVCVCLSVIISLCSWVIVVYVDAVYWFCGCSFLCLIGCFSMIAWAPTVF